VRNNSGFLKISVQFMKFFCVTLRQQVCSKCLQYHIAYFEETNTHHYVQLILTVACFVYDSVMAHKAIL